MVPALPHEARRAKRGDTCGTRDTRGILYYMRVIYLAGNSLGNKAWIEKVKSEFDTFSSGAILYYNHWVSGEKFIHFEAESQKLAELVKDKKNYFVFAKSVGTILALKTIYEGKFKPKKAIFCGLPYRLAGEVGIPLDKYLTSLEVPTTFVQNESDPVYSFGELKKVLVSTKPSNYQLILNPNNNTHDYEDYNQLINLANNFFK